MSDRPKNPLPSGESPNPKATQLGFPTPREEDSFEAAQTAIQAPPDSLALPVSGTDETLEAGAALTRAYAGKDAAPAVASWDVSDLPVVAPESYAVAGEFARGGLGRILKARDKRLGRPVALKELLRGGNRAVNRFVREALVTARLQHPAIVPVYEAGRWPDGSPFFAMKLVSGRSLADVIRDAR